MYQGLPFSNTHCGLQGNLYCSYSDLLSPYEVQYQVINLLAMGVNFRVSIQLDHADYVRVSIGLLSLLR